MTLWVVAFYNKSPACLFAHRSSPSGDVKYLICHVTSQEHMMWGVFPLYNWEVQGYIQAQFYVQYADTKTQSLIAF